MPSSVAAGDSRPRLITPALAALFAASIGAMSSFHLLLSVVPAYAAEAGAGSAGAGAASAALLLSTVISELAAPRLVTRFGHRAVYAAGLVLLGAPALLLPISDTLPAIAAISAVRGLGFGLVVVLGSTLVAMLAPPERRGEGLGLFGIIMSGPAVLALPFGIYVAGRIAYTPVFIAGGVAALVGLAIVARLPGRQPRDETQTPVWGVLAGLRTPSMMRPALTFAATAVAYGVVVTFVPLAIPGASTELVAAALLVKATAMVVARWWAGWYGDRGDPSQLIIPSLVAATVGIVLFATVGGAVAVLVAMVLFGLGFGVMQNASLATMFQRAPVSGYAMVGAVWNVAYDAAMGLGALGFGVIVAGTGYSGGFAIVAALMVLAVVPALRDRSRGAAAGGVT